MIQRSLPYGIIIGSIISVILLAGYFFRLTTYENISSAVNIAIIFGLAISLRHLREHRLNGFMSYGQSVGNGTFILLLASLMYSLVFYVLLKTNGNLLEYLIDEMYNAFLQNGLEEEQVEEFFEIFEKLITPGLFALSTFFGLFVNGFIFLLLISIFVKRTPQTPFDA